MTIKSIFVRSALLAAVMLMSACASMGEPTISESSRTQLVEEARISLNELYQTTPKARELRPHAKAVLVFPDILKAGLIVGGSGGDGVLFSPDGRVLGYYNAASASYGLQAGAQTYSQAIFFTTNEALKYLDNSNGWSIGTGPSVVVVDKGVGRDLSSTTLRSGVFAFIYGQEGLMGGIGLQGQKITRLQPSH